MPLPTPNADESQSDYMARCMPIVAEDSTYDTQEQRVAVCMTQFRSATKGVKILDESKGLLGGWGIPFGGPVKSKEHPDGLDLDREYFDGKTEFCFDWFPNEGRPVLYDHGTDKDVGLTRVGIQTTKAVDDKMGVWVETQLDMANRYAKYILELAKKGVLGYSSGALGGYVQRASNGYIKRWPFIEQTLTVRPANPYALIPADAVKHFEGIDMPEPIVNAAKIKIIEIDGVTYAATPVDAKAVWSASYIDALPDSAFAWIDAEGDRHLPHHDASGKVDKAHVDDAMGRAEQMTPPPPASAIEHLKAHQAALGEDVTKKLTLPDGMSMEDFRCALKKAIEEVAVGDPEVWVADVKDSTAIASVFTPGDTDYYAFEFTIAADGTVKVNGPGAKVRMETTFVPEDEGKALRDLAAHLESVGWSKAGRVMSARNMGQLHESMKAMGDLHGSTCDMGADCPLVAATAPSGKTEEPLNIPDLDTPQRKARRAEVDAYLATIRVGGNSHA